MHKILFGSVGVFAALALLLLSGCNDEPKYEGPALPYKTETPKQEPNPVVMLKTSDGDITLELFEDDAPNTVANFVHLAETGFYNNTTFHRVVKGFMIQGGDPKADGSGGPGYCIPDELTNNPHKHDRYALSMAKRTPPNTGGSQFFIVTALAGKHDLDNLHTVFGKVTQGFEIVDKIESAPVVGEKPVNPVKVLSVTVVSKRGHEYKAWRTLPEDNTAAAQAAGKPQMITMPPHAPGARPASAARTLTLPAPKTAPTRTLTLPTPKTAPAKSNTVTVPLGNPAATPPAK